VSAQGPGEQPRDLVIIAHRGASGYAPEHTFSAWDLALELGADYLEQDLQMTSDGVLVVMHDETLDRTARGLQCRGLVRNRTLEQIQQCDAGSWFNQAFPERARPEYANERVPTLDAVLGHYHERGRFYIETKQPEESPGMETELIRLLDAHNLLPVSPEDRQVIVQSFSSASLQLLHAIEPRLFLVKLFHRIETGRLLHRRLARIATYARGIGPNFRTVDARLVHAAHDLGLVLHPYTVNEPADMARLTDIGVDGMFTDYPDRLYRLRNS
jgi:glycerophosphoryl diester phosphodiesterase